jgi:hypothetical protein
MIGYHGGGSIPLANVRDSSWRRQYAWYPREGQRKSKLPDYARIGPVKQSILPLSSIPKEFQPTSITWTVNGRRTRREGHGPAAIAAVAIEAVERALARPPEASVDLTVARSSDSISVLVTVDSIVGIRRRLALRIVLLEDTVRLRGGTRSRLVSNVMRDHAVTPELPLGLPLAATRSTTLHTFDIAKIRNELMAQRDPKVTAGYVHGLRRAESEMKETEEMYISKFPIRAIGESIRNGCTS